MDPHLTLNSLLRQGSEVRRVLIEASSGATVDGRPTTLGRGGSDFSASIVAAAIDAQELWIWTDVDGIMTADPRVMKEVAVLDELTYAEATELAHNNANVLHPRTLGPLLEKKIPVWSKNSFAPEKPGTRILPRVQQPGDARAIDALALGNVEILVFTSSSYRQSFCFLIRKHDLVAALEALEANLCIELAHGYFKPIEVDENVALLTVVGEGMRGTRGLEGRVFTAISRKDINIIAIAQGSSELKIGIVVRLNDVERAVCAVHDEVIWQSALSVCRLKSGRARRRF